MDGTHSLPGEIRPRRHEQVAYRVFGDQAVLVAPTVQRVYLLNETGTWIWERLDGRHSLTDLAGALARRHGICRDEAQDAVCAFIAGLADRALLSEEHPTEIDPPTAPGASHHVELSP